MLSDIIKKKLDVGVAASIPDLKYNKAGKPTSKELASAIETVRDLLFREFGEKYSFTISGDGYVLASQHPGITIHAVVTGSEEK